MNGEKILVILAIISFAIGALAPTLVVGGGPRSINWLCAGFAFISAACLFTLPFR